LNQVDLAIKKSGVMVWIVIVPIEATSLTVPEDLPSTVDIEALLGTAALQAVFEEGVIDWETNIWAQHAISKQMSLEQ
jgi:hypothetical protein